MCFSFFEPGHVLCAYGGDALGTEINEAYFLGQKGKIFKMSSAEILTQRAKG